MSNKRNTSRWFMDRYCIHQELIKTLVDGLDRALTHQEINALNRIVDSNYETREIILDLFKELVKKQKNKG